MKSRARKSLKRSISNLEKHLFIEAKLNPKYRDEGEATSIPIKNEPQPEEKKEEAHLSEQEKQIEEFEAYLASQTPLREEVQWLGDELTAEEEQNRLVLYGFLSYVDQGAPESDPRPSMFTASYKPSVSLVDYWYRLEINLEFEPYESLCVLSLFIEFNKSNSPATLNALTKHRLLLTCACIVNKCLKEEAIINADIAKVGGVSTKELNAMEVELLSYFNFDFYAGFFSSERLELLPMSIRAALPPQLFEIQLPPLPWLGASAQPFETNAAIADEVLESWFSRQERRLPHSLSAPCSLFSQTRPGMRASTVIAEKENQPSNLPLLG